MANNILFCSDEGSCRGRLYCLDSEECKRYATLDEPREICECKPGTTRPFWFQGIRIVQALEFDEQEMRPPCVDPSDIGSYVAQTKFKNPDLKADLVTRRAGRGVKIHAIHSIDEIAIILCNLSTSYLKLLILTWRSWGMFITVDVFSPHRWLV